ncbi:alpha/beta hydrolase family protein [Actinomadura sp. SCN-SB]|mgnify:CR=1 FL=1|uniref:alpha/beta hydrolase family protein n=1 Tax=Actinomadura sp. SCN-SB TaxID=3373092 RepID=UPI003751158C
MPLPSGVERGLLEVPVPSSGRIDVFSGVARLSGAIWASEVRRTGTCPSTALLIVHPTANFLGHYALGTLASMGVAAVGMCTRYVGSDANLNIENCLLDIGATITLLRRRGYERVVLVGNSGGGSIVPYYQAQAEHPTVTAPPGGVGPDLTQAGLPPADSVVLFMAHPSRARLSAEWLDPAIIDEAEPFGRDPELDAFSPENGPPYSAEFIARYREAQLARNRRITRWAQRQLNRITAPGNWPHGLDDISFVVHGTSADLRFLDPAVDAGDRDSGDREAGTTLWGRPEIAGYLPAGLGRYTSLRSWINQWSVDETNGDALRWLPKLRTPTLVVGGSADTGAPPVVLRQLYDAIEVARKDHVLVQGATHYFEGRPDLLEQACEAMVSW